MRSTLRLPRTGVLHAPGRRLLAGVAPALALTFCAGATLAEDVLPPVSPAGPPELFLAAVSDSPKRAYRSLKPLADYIQASMPTAAPMAVRVRVAGSHRELVKLWLNAEADWVRESPYMAVALEQLTGAEISLKLWSAQDGEQNGVVIVRSDSGISALQQLRGRTIAFENPTSTHAFFLPATRLMESGLHLARLDTPRERPPADAVGYLFSGGVHNTAVWVHKGLADAGVVSARQWRTSDALPVGYRTHLRVIHATERVPVAVTLVREGLDGSIKSALRDILLTAHRTPQGKVALDKLGPVEFAQLNADDARALVRVRRSLSLIPAQMD